MKSDNKSVRKFNIVDAIIIILAIALVAFLSMQYTKVKTPNTIASGMEEKDIYFDIRVKNVTSGSEQNLEVGDAIRFNAKTMDYGTIEEIKDVEPSVATFVDEKKGEFVEKGYEHKIDFTVTVKAKGYETDEQIVAGNLKVTVGGSVFIKAQNYAAQGYIYDVRVAE